MELVQEIGALQYNDAYDVAIITVNDGSMTFGNSCGTGNFAVEDLIDGAEYIDNVPLVQVRQVFDYKMQSASAKDLRHIELLKRSKYSALAEQTD